jgi:hypothetical protein
MSNCNVLELFNNVTSNCDNDIEVVKDDCKIICLMSIAKALDMCYFELFNTALLDQMKDIIKWCYYQKYEPGHRTSYLQVKPHPILIERNFCDTCHPKVGPY